MFDFIRKDFTLLTLNNGQKILYPNNYEVLKINKEYIQSLRIFLALNEGYLDSLNDIKDEAIQLKESIENYLND